MKTKRLLFSESGMRAVNALFFLSLLIRDRGLIFAAYTVWIAYLAYCVKRTSSRTAQTAYKGLIAFAAGMLLLNAYGLIRYCTV